VRDFNKQADNSVHDGAGRRKVVERDERVHLELGRREELLHHDQAGGLESDSGELEEETNHDELDLAVGSDDYTEDDEGDVAESLHVRRGDAHGPGCDEHSDRSGGLDWVLEGRNICGFLPVKRTLSIWMKETER
jgi:hypothetical protein